MLEMGKSRPHPHLRLRLRLSPSEFTSIGRVWSETSETSEAKRIEIKAVSE